MAEPTVNEAFFDALVRHQIGLLRLTGSIRAKVLDLLNKSEQDMADKILGRLAGQAPGLDTPSSVKRLQTLLKAVRATRLRSWKQVTEAWVAELREVAKAEPAFVDGLLKTVTPVVLETVLPSAGLLSTLVTSRPFEGKVLRSWARDISRSDLDRIEGQIRIGMVQGESAAAIARRVVGSARLKGRDGVTEITRRHAAGITRTAVIALSNAAKREFYNANSQYFTQELYVATLDARTTPICRSLDGKTFPVGEGPLPPLHFNCRSVRVALLSASALGTRPMRNFTEQQMVREFREREGIPGPASRASLPRGTKGAFDAFRQRRIRELTGTTPAKVTYQQWLGRQSAVFQDDILGKTRGRLFRRGGLTLDKFVNRAGDELPLSELARVHRAAFEAAGLDPEDFL